MDSLQFFMVLAKDSSINDYKVLRILNMHGEFQTNKPLVEAEIYPLKKGCWKTITANTPTHRFMDRSSQALANGVVHWIAIWEGRSYEYSVLGLCMATEGFNEIMLPESLANATRMCMSINAHRESSIAVAYKDYDRTLMYYVWVMTEYGVSESWVKLYGLPERWFMPHVLGFGQSGLVLLEIQDGMIFSFDPESEEMSHRIWADRGYNFVDSYVETMVLLDRSDANFVAEASDDHLTDKAIMEVKKFWL